MYVPIVPKKRGKSENEINDLKETIESQVKSLSDVKSMAYSEILKQYKT